jgi:hypothetical protein
MLRGTSCSVIMRFPLSPRLKFCEEIARVRVARTILAAAEWRDRFARDIGWRKMRFSAQRKTALQKIIAETERRAQQTAVWGA